VQIYGPFEAMAKVRVARGAWHTSVLGRVCNCVWRRATARCRGYGRRKYAPLSAYSLLQPIQELTFFNKITTASSWIILTTMLHTLSVWGINCLSSMDIYADNRTFGKT
jgi:hypothetical protein